MRKCNRILDFFFLVLVVMILVGLPFGIFYYDQHVSAKKIPSNARVFTLTGHAERGWLMGEVPAYDAISFWQKQGQPIERPVIEVKKGELVVLKLASSDVVHGFSLKDFGVYLKDGIQPGKVIHVSFTADKIGTFTFSCNAICGDMHQNMQGTLVVRA
ncbi:MAG: cupredoxin domain-containing protein [Deltaproteobacteria bacterium]|jgi:heme/copper-type cytochrome/quinol oxidase subunit 2|nr:cupredoxin domain-containing protein [Deltaproteobacteria bacterium]